MAKRYHLAGLLGRYEVECLLLHQPPALGDRYPLGLGLSRHIHHPGLALPVYVRKSHIRILPARTQRTPEFLPVPGPVFPPGPAGSGGTISSSGTSIIIPPLTVSRKSFFTASPWLSKVISPPAPLKPRILVSRFFSASLSTPV